MKFSIRDLLLVTVIVALAVAWWVDRSRLAKTAKRLQHDLGMRYTVVKSTWKSFTFSSTRLQSAREVTRAFSCAGV